MLAQFIVSGIVVGCVYALVAVGFTVIYDATETVNFAVGESLMIGAYFLLTFWVLWEIPYLWSLALTLLASGALGYLVYDRLVSRPLMGAGLLPRVVALMGMAAILKGLARVIWGADAYHLPPPITAAPLRFGPVAITAQEILIVVVTVAVVAGLYVFFRYTKLGTAMRATSQSRRAASLMGVNVSVVFAAAWIIGTMLSAVGGVLLAPLLLVDPDMGELGIKSFTAAVLGGFGSLAGAIVGGVLLGVVENLVAGYLRADWQNAATFVLMVLVLAIRPTGLFGKADSTRV